MKILFTGASSFTGFWFARMLGAAGHELVCPIRGALEAYEGLRKRRMEALKSQCQFVPQAPFGERRFLDLVTQAGPWDLLCHHAAEVTDYKSPDFDPQAALRNNTWNLPEVLTALKATRTKGVVLTGTIFEPDEGAGGEPLRAFSPYGLSKGLTWQVFRFYCGRAELPLGKFVLPNPFGPFEEARFTAYLMRTWREGKPATVTTPAYIRDNIPADLLARAYVCFCEEVAARPAPAMKANPSGYIESQGAFAERVAREVGRRTPWKCELSLTREQNLPEPLLRVNTEPAMPRFPEWNESRFWDEFVEFYRGGG
jgi:nucleoside-diphosphate-sugar epimerase